METITTIPKGNIMNNNTQTPYVGMPCTRIVGSDKYGCSIKEIKRNGKTIIIGETIELRGGKTKEREITYTLRDNGRWILKGEHKNYVTLSLQLGQAITSLDRGF